MIWRILIESTPGRFTPTGATFTGSVDEVEAHLAAPHAETGQCHAAEATQ